MDCASQNGTTGETHEERDAMTQSFLMWLEQFWRTTSQFVYDVSYLTGSWLFRGLEKVGRRLLDAGKTAGHCAQEWFGRWLMKARSASSGLGVHTAIRRLREEYRALWSEEGVLLPGKTALFALKYLWRFIRTALNYACPVAAIGVLVYTVQYFTSLPLALQVEYDGQNIGYIMDESVFDEAESMVRSRIIYEEYEEPVDAVPKFTLTVADESQLSDSFTIADQMIQYSGNEIVQADGLYIDDEFVGATTDGESMLLMLESLKEPYLEEYPDAKVEFTSKIRVRQGLYPVSSVVELANIEEYISSEVEGEKVYIAQAGDAPITIARSNGISLSNLVELNPEIESKLLVGQEVLISKSQPLLGIKATVTESYTEEVPFKIEKTVDNSQYSTYSKVVSTGVNGLREVEEEVVYVNGSVAERNILSTETLVEPVNQEIVVGSMMMPSYSTPLSGGSATSDGYIWPVGGTGGSVTCYLYGYPGHTGMDIGASTGTPIYATAAGTVQVATQRSGYGKYIIIDHGNGLQTYYLHCSALYVTVGQQVNQGQTIAAVGQTGNATGPHLHIEFRVNGAVKNPANYIGTR